MAHITTQGYKIIARGLGIAKEAIVGMDIGLQAYEVVEESIIAELIIDNPNFDEAKFKLAIEASAKD